MELEKISADNDANKKKALTDVKTIEEKLAKQENLVSRIKRRNREEKHEKQYETTETNIKNCHTHQKKKEKTAKKPKSGNNRKQKRRKDVNNAIQPFFLNYL